jgi:hypothetical protein
MKVTHAGSLPISTAPAVDPARMERRALGCPFHGGLVSPLQSQEAKTHLGRRILARRSHFGAMMIG